jgi:hypothetical protein
METAAAMGTETVLVETLPDESAAARALWQHDHF